MKGEILASFLRTSLSVRVNVKRLNMVTVIVSSVLARLQKIHSRAVSAPSIGVSIDRWQMP